mgnify:CR=1 FL=1
MHLGRKRLGSAAAGLALVAVAGLIPAGSASAKPDIASVQARVDSLYRQAEQASEEYNQARLELADLQPMPPGIRAQAVSRDGQLIHDFLLKQTARSLHVCNAPSPAATAAFPIAAELVARAGL